MKNFFYSMRFSVLLGGIGLLSWVGCATSSEQKPKKYLFPEKYAYIGVPDRGFEKLGGVRSKVTWPTLNIQSDDADLCQNFFNQAAIDLVRTAKKNGADAVIDVRSVVLLMDGRTETYSRPECTDDGAEGEVLLQGVAVKWKKLVKKDP